MRTNRGKIIICIVSILLFICVYIVMNIGLNKLHKDKEVYNRKLSYVFENIEEMKAFNLKVVEYDEFELTNNSTLVYTEIWYLPYAYVDLYFKEGQEVAEN